MPSWWFELDMTGVKLTARKLVNAGSPQMLQLEDQRLIFTSRPLGHSLFFHIHQAWLQGSYLQQEI